MIARVLLALDEAVLQRQIKKGLSRPDVLVDVPRARGHLWKRINRETCDLVILGVTFVPFPKTEMIASFSEIPDAPALVLVTGRNDPEERAILLAAGADEVLFSGLTAGSMLDVLDRILNRRRTMARQGFSPARPITQPRLTDFISNSPVMQRFMEMVARVVPGSSSLLIQGETGVGKERLARAVHSEGPRSSGPFIAINCGALPESLLESELFGHEEGAFTGATRARRGCFEMAHNGTIFLDEIGEMPLHVQVHLLRVLQDHEVQRIGSEQPIRVNVRVMAATNKDLAEKVAAGVFRRDLFYRLSVVALTVPPLRERREDIPELVEAYLDYLRPKVGREIAGVSSDALAAMTRYGWPGNVRELINVVERAMLLCAADDMITLSDLPDTVSNVRRSGFFESGEAGGGSGDALLPEGWLDLPLASVRIRAVDGVERSYLAGLLARTGGRVGETARLAGVTPRALYSKMRRHGLRKEDFKR